MLKRNYHICLVLLGFMECSLSFATTTIHFWHSMAGPKAKLLTEIVESFNSLPENKDTCHVELQFVGSYIEGMNKLRTSLIGKKGPHIAQIYDIGTQVMVDSKAIIPLHDFIDKDPNFPLDKLLKPIRRYYEIGARLQSLPFATSNPILYYNAERFSKAKLTQTPKTFAELVTISKKLTDKSKQLTGITWPLHSWFFEEFLAKQGAELVNNQNGRASRATEALLSQPAAIEFVKLWEGMVKEGSFAHAGRGWEPSQHNFLAGRSAMLITSTSDVFEISQQASFKVKTAPLPTKDLSQKGGTVVGGNSLWILKSKSTQEDDYSYRFVRYMADAKVQEKWHTQTGYFPIREDVIAKLEKDGFYKKYPNAWTAIEQLRNSADIPATHGALLGNFPQLREQVESAIEEVLAGKKSVEESLAMAKQKCDADIKKYHLLKNL